MRDAVRHGAGAAAPVAGRVPAGRLAVRHLALTDFRCYRSARLELDGRSVVLTGLNGAGKTNLLEALSFLAPGRGLRRARLEELDRRDGQGSSWGVAATLAGAAGSLEIGTGRDPESEPAAARRLVRIDGKPARGQSELARHLSVLWVTPEMDRLFQDGPSARRRFLDRMVYGLDPDHARRLAAYEQAMRQRLRLLREGCRDEAWLVALESAMAELGTALAAARITFLARLELALAEDSGPFPRAAVALAGTLERWLEEAPALAVEERFKARLAASRAEDAAAGSTSEGPQRSDLVVRQLASGVPAAQASTGEQKALLLALVLAEARLQALERGRPPLLLLDEVAAHLDRVRRTALYEALDALGAQAWMTGTEPAMFDNLGERAQHFRVVDGNAVAR